MDQTDLRFGRDFTEKVAGSNEIKQPKERPARFGNLLYLVLSEQKAETILKTIDRKRIDKIHGKALKENEQFDERQRLKADAARQPAELTIQHEPQGLQAVLPGMYKAEYDAALEAARAPVLEHNVISHRRGKDARYVRNQTPVGRPRHSNVANDPRAEETAYTGIKRARKLLAREPEHLNLANADPFADEIALAAVQRARARIDSNKLPKIQPAYPRPGSSAFDEETHELRIVIPRPRQEGGGSRTVDDSDVPTEQFEKVN